MYYRDIPQFPTATYEVDVPWDSLERHLSRWADLDLDPDFQRGHVWTEQQQRAFVEYSLRGGKSARNIYFNSIDWKYGRNPVQLIDGKQRLEAVRRFLRDELPVFGGALCSEIGLPPFDPMLRFHVHEMPTRRDVLMWYLGMNSGGSVHTPEELARVRELLEAA